MGRAFHRGTIRTMIMQLERGRSAAGAAVTGTGRYGENRPDWRKKIRRITPVLLLKRNGFFYQLKIGAAMAASLVLLALPMGHGSYEESPYGKAQQMVQEEEEKESLLDYMQQGTKILSDGVTGFSDFAMKQITEVLDYGK